MRLKIALKRIGVLLVLYSVLRLIFLVFNSHSFQKFSPELILGCFTNGLRFDLAAVLVLNVPLLLATVLVAKKIYHSALFQRALKIVFILVNFPFIFANLIDSEYYKFTGNRMTAEIFFFKSEAAHQADQFILNYWYIAVLALLYFVALLRFYPEDKSPMAQPTSASRRQHLRRLAVSVVMSLALLLGIRGGLQAKPLQPAHAYLAGFVELGVLTLNSTFTLLKSKVSAKLKPAQYLSSPQDVYAELKQHEFSYPALPQKQNVVIIILESFATEFWGAANTYKGYTPFLDSLASQGLFFKNNFASGRRSIDALPAILFGVPTFMSTPLVRSNYFANKWNGIGTALRNNGYHASFFHGAPKGTMYFDAISAQAGLNDYFPLERYQGPPQFDGNWGIYDEPFLQFMIKELNKQPQPFLSTVFTISTHQPYHVPPEYTGRFPKGTLKIHESVGYVDYALKQFFTEAAKQPWYKNTLFVITGDHTQMSEAEHYNSTLGRFMVPLLFYHPTQKLTAANPNRITQQTDIMPSILDFLGLHQETHLLFGRSVFDSEQEGESIFSSDGSFWLVREKNFLRFSEAENKSYLFSIDDLYQKASVTDQEDLHKAMETRLQSYIQYFRNGLIENTLYAWKAP